MVRDYSNVPASKTIKNETGSDIILDLRDILQIPTIIKDGKSVTITVNTSEGLAILDHKIAELGLEFGDGAEPQPSRDETKVDSAEALVSALEEIEDGGTVIFTSDIALSEDLTIDKDILLSLGENSLDLSDKQLRVKGEVEIWGKNDSKITSENKNCGVVVDGGKLTLDGGIIESTKLYGIMVGETGEVEINGGSIISADSCIATNNRENKFVRISINGGELTSKTDAAMYIPSPCEIEINGGTLNGGISARMGTITVNGGTINSITKDNDPIEKFYNYSGNVWLGDAIACMAGTYVPVDESQTNDLDLTIYGGTINGLCQGCSAVTIYNLGAVEQNINVTIAPEATLAVVDEEQPVYKVVEAVDIVPEKAKDYDKYTKFTNVVNEDVDLDSKPVIDNPDDIDDLDDNIEDLDGNVDDEF